MTLKKLFLAMLVLGMSSCYPKINIEGFDQNEWLAPITNCSQNKVNMANLIIDQQQKLLGKGQAEVKGLLGQPIEHELYQRNQKFFYYNLTPADTCGQVKTALRLSIRFDAIDRAKEVMIVE